MNMNVEVITSFIGIAGLALAAILSSLGYLYRGWVESKRSARKVLYLLLEIRYALGASLFNSEKASKEYINHYTKRLKEKGINVSKEEVEAQIAEIVKSHFSNLTEVSKTDIKERLLHPFEDALYNLSQVSPVLAYMLRGKEKLEAFAGINVSYLDSNKSMLVSTIGEEWAKEAILEFVHEMEEEVLQKMSRNLDEEIVLLSKHCGWLESYRCKKVLSTKFGEFDQEIFSELDKFIDKFIEKITIAANKALQPLSD